MARRPTTDPPPGRARPEHARPRHDHESGKHEDRSEVRRGRTGEPAESGRNSGHGSEETRRTES